LPKFTVIIPTRNRPQYLGEAVASVLKQSLADFELLIVNDGDTALPPFKDPRIHILNNQSLGAVAARNLGVAKARGAYIAFLDDDDVWSQDDHLAHATNKLSKTTDFYFADGEMKFPDGSTKLFAQAADVQSLQRDNTILVSAICYKKSLHAKLGTFDLALPYYWDWDWYLRVANSGAQLYRRAFPVVDIRIHAQNMSGDSNLLARRANLNLLELKHDLAKIELKGHLDFV
jgi:glycosyltransferase involved in cell wall biosynthesis